MGTHTQISLSINPKLTIMKKVIFILFTQLSITFALSQTVNVIQDGSFTAGTANTAWNTTPDFYYNTAYSNGNGDNNYAYLSTPSGNKGNNLTGYLTQNISNYPPNIISGEIKFYYSVSTDETSSSSNDIVGVYLIIDGSANIIGAFSNLTNPNLGYTLQSVDLSQDVIDQLNSTTNTVTLSFIGTTNNSAPSTMRVDDVQLLLTEDSSGSGNLTYNISAQNSSVSNNSPDVGQSITLSTEQTISGNCNCSGNISPNPKMYFGYSTTPNDPFNSTFITVASSTIGTDIFDIETANFTIPSGFEGSPLYIYFIPDYYDDHENETIEGDYEMIQINVTDSNNGGGCEAVSITSQPQNKTQSVGNTVTFSVSVDGTAPFTYQWKKNGTNITSANNQSYTTPSLTQSDNGNIYRCEITNCNSNNSITSNNATLTVTGNTSSSFIEINNIIDGNSAFSTPKLLWSGNTSQSIVPIKICAEGSKSTQIKFTNNSSIPTENLRFGILSDLSSQDIDSFGTFYSNDYSTNSAGELSVRFTHPKYYSSTLNNFRNDSIIIYDVNNSNNIIATIPIEVYKAPVLFVHGLWGNLDSFNSLQNFLHTKGFIPELTKNVNYQPTNDISFYDNRAVVPVNINDLIAQARNSNFSTSKVDIIAHSMGGILSRQYIQSNPFQIKQNVNKLITLNTPHSGSPFGNLINNPILGPNFVIIGEALAYFAFNGGSVLNGAVTDLAIDSDAMNNLINGSQNLNNGIVPSHTITTTETLASAGGVFYTIASALAASNSQTVNAFFNSLFSNQPNDLVVPLESQTGGLIGNSTSSPPFNGISHIPVTKKTIIHNELLILLNKNPDSDSFTTNGFNPADISSFYRISQQNTNSNFIDGSVTITSPNLDQTFNAGEIVNVNVATQNGVNRIVFSGINKQENSSVVEDINSTTGSFQYLIPDNVHDKIIFFASGYDSSNNLIDFDIISININPNSNVANLEFDQSTLFIEKGNIANVTIIATRSNGISHQLNDSSGIQFSISDNNIASQMSGITFIGNTVGATTLNATYQGFNLSIPVVVYNNDDTTPDISTLSIGEIDNINPSEVITIFPNPATNVLNIKNTNNIYLKNIEVYDIQGKLVFETSEEIDIIDISNYASGLYVLKIHTDDSIESFKFLKE